MWTKTTGAHPQALAQHLARRTEVKTKYVRQTAGLPGTSHIWGRSAVKLSI